MKIKDIKKWTEKHPLATKLALTGGLGTTGVILLAEGQPVGMYPILGQGLATMGILAKDTLQTVKLAKKKKIKKVI
jgi:hypothetical protein